MDVFQAKCELGFRPFQPRNMQVAAWEASHRPGPSPGHSVGTHRGYEAAGARGKEKTQPLEADWPVPAGDKAPV